MGIWSNLFGTRREKPQPKVKRGPVAMRAGALDSVSYSTDDVDYWKFANSVTGDQIANHADREEARKRCRYQYLNDPYARNIVRNLAVAVVGTGATIQIIGDKDNDKAEVVEDRFKKWANAVGLHETVSLMVQSLGYDGESFLQFVQNPKMPQGVSVAIIDPARICTPTFGAYNTQFGIDENVLDGIRFDTYGNPTYYAVAESPINPIYTGIPIKFKRVKAEEIFHLFIKDLPEQHRGLPLLQSVVKTLAALRRYMMAVIECAEVAASHSFVVKSQTLPDQEAPADWDAMDEILAPRRGGVVLPRGWEASQLKSEHPSAQHAEFIQTTITAVGAGFGQPRNIAAADSSNYNYASGRLDHQTFFRYIETVQELVRNLYCFVFRWWYRYDLESQELFDNADPKDIELDWYFAELAHVDPEKEANTAIMLRDKGLLTDAEYFAKFGQDWRKQYKQMKLESKSRDGEQQNTGTIEETAMNGAQVTSATDIVTKVSMGELPPEAAIEMLVAFFQLPKDVAKAIIEPASKITIEPKDVRGN